MEMKCEKIIVFLKDFKLKSFAARRYNARQAVAPGRPKSRDV